MDKQIRQADKWTERKRERESIHISVKYLAEIIFTHCHRKLML